MQEREFHFRGQMNDETVIDFFRRHWIVLVPHVSAYGLCIMLTFLLLFFLPRFQLPSLTEAFFQLIVILSLMAVCFVIHKFFLYVIEYYMNVVIITNYRVVEVRKSLFLQDDKESIVLKRMQDIQKQQGGLLKSIFKFGEIHILISFADPKIIRNVPTPDYHFRLLNHIRNADSLVTDNDRIQRKPDLKNGRGLDEDNEDPFKNIESVRDNHYDTSQR